LVAIQDKASNEVIKTAADQVAEEGLAEAAGAPSLSNGDDQFSRMGEQAEGFLGAYAPIEITEQHIGGLGGA
jgi:hypothetical protein